MRRTRQQWRAFDRLRLVGSVGLAALLILLWWAGAGPSRAGACCAVGEPSTAAVRATSPGPASAEPAPPEGLAAEAAPVPTPQSTCPSSIETIVRFATNSADIPPAGRDALDALVPCLDRGPYTISGYADSSGSAAINDPLSEDRARAVRDYLVGRGVDADRLEASGYGASSPVADNAAPEGRARNRRVEIHPR